MLAPEGQQARKYPSPCSMIHHPREYGLVRAHGGARLREVEGMAVSYRRLKRAVAIRSSSARLVSIRHDYYGVFL